MNRDIALAAGSHLKSIAVLYVTPRTASHAMRTLESLATNGLGCAEIIVAAGSVRLDRDAAAVTAGPIPLSFADEAQVLSAVARGVRTAGAAGVVLVSAGMHVPRAFDVRLARIAMEDRAVATVSPFCDLSPIHRLREAAFPDAELPAAEVERLDRLAFLLGRRTYFEVPECLAECCFVTKDAIDKLARGAIGSLSGVVTWIEQLAHAGLTHVLSDSVYVGAPPASAIVARAGAPRAGPRQLERSRREIVDAFAAGTDFKSAPGLDARPVQLHVIHDLGGGSETWLRDYALADSSRTNLVLKSLTDEKSMGFGLALYTHALDEMPLRTWKLSNDIGATAPVHLEYRGILAEIIAEYCVDGLLVSSLIGHSLDVLDTGLPTVVVMHDYFPYCPAINIYFDGVCRKCDGQRIGECHRENRRFNPFDSFLPEARLAVRERFMDLMRRPGVTMATPSRSVADNLSILNPLFKQVRAATIPHGYGTGLARIEGADPAPAERLRVLVLGQLSVLKGVELLRGALPELRRFADIYLLGCRELGELFKYEPGVHVISQYEIDDLPVHMANINPHVALLMSIVPETFNYALTELMMLGVPAAATRVGSFVERIEHGETGYLYEPDVASLVAMARQIDADRDTLARIRGKLRGWRPRSAPEMVADYHRLAPMAAMPQARYPLKGPGADPGGASPSRDQALVAQSATLAGMWKEVKSMHVNLTIVNEARSRELRRYEERSLYLERRAADAEKQRRELEASLEERSRNLEVLSGRLDVKTAQLAEVHASTSWKLSSPIRAVGWIVRDLKTLARVLKPALRDPALLPEHAATLMKGLRADGWRGFKRALLGLQSFEGYRDSWHRYRGKFRTEVKPRIVRHVRSMSARPLVSVIVPTYNTPETMLRQMLHSVQAQLYPHWELCIADDGSTQPHVEAIVREFAAKDRRIRMEFGRENRGVSHASNRALAMAGGEFVVLLDHDDILEEQALFRVAQSVVEDNPDVVYSDELLVTPDAATVKEAVYRPAFSPELLRGHPYIVHLVGLRTQLVRDVGGFDETLRISQDYDLILRAVEKARTVAHIPEVLYQWRVHGDSAGHQKMHEVMDTSRRVLQRHLERNGQPGTVRDGAGFNLFDARYPLDPGLRVAIIIPTKNHGELLRKCVESIRDTVKGIAYEIVVVDHESDDPDTQAYLASISATARVLRYQGVFNFSAINNFAVSQLSGEFTHYLFCNNDIEAIHAGWLERMLELGQRRSIGVVGAKLFYTDRKTIQHAGVCVGAFGAAEHYGKFLRMPDNGLVPGYLGAFVVNHEVSAVTAACMLVRKDAFEQVSGFDGDLAVGFGDVDLCLRIAERGYRILFCPYAELVHHESYTRGTSPKDPHPADTALFRIKWKKLLEAGDPHYNPGLSLTRTDWSTREPLECNFAIRRRIFTRDPQAGESLTFSLPDRGG